MYGYIYLTTNLVNGMIYVGQHKSSVFIEKYLGSGTLLKRAVIKYGKSNFSVKLLEWCDTQQTADEREKHWETVYGLPDVSIGYNITKGGQMKFFTDCKHSSEAKEKMSKKASLRHPKPTTLHRTCYTDGITNKMLTREQIGDYEKLGWHKGKKMSGKPAWNKGLTKETSDAVRKYAEIREDAFKNGKSIGCFGIKGNTNGFKKGEIPWNKGLFGYNDGHPNYYHGKRK